MHWSDVRWLLIVAVAATLFTILVFPYFSRFGYANWTIPVYVFFFVVFLYGRANRHTIPPRRHVR